MSSDFVPRCEPSVPPGPDLDESALSVYGTPCGYPLVPLLLLEEQESSSGPPQVIPLSACTALPEVGPLIKELPEIIRRAAAYKNLPVPVPVSAPPDDVMGGLFPPQAARRDAVWPRFPAMIKYQSGAAEEPGRLRAPVHTYVPLTKVVDYTERGFAPVPPLESSLADYFGARLTDLRGGRRPVPPSSGDQLTARLADRSHQCALQAAAAANNICVLADSLRSLAAQPGLLPPEQAAELGKASSAILTLCASITVCSTRIAAWQVLIHRNLWLLVSSIPEEHRKELLEAPISPDGLFGPGFQEVLTGMQAAARPPWDRPARRRRRQ